MKVIVDGVDVSGCEFYTANIKYNCKLDTVGGDNTCFICSNNPNCYYKQLQRLEEECDELKRDNKRMKAILDGCGLEENGDCFYCNVDKAYHELEQENKEMKESIEKLLKVQYSLADNCKKYKQTLEDTKNEMSDKYQFGGLNGYEDFCKYYEREYTRIINKINEVLND